MDVNEQLQQIEMETQVLENLSAITKRDGNQWYPYWQTYAELMQAFSNDLREWWNETTTQTEVLS